VRGEFSGVAAMAGVAGAGAGGGQFPATPRSAGAERLPEEEGGRSRGVRVRGWDVRTGSGSILGQAGIAEAEKALGTSHLPELFFGDSFLEMKHRVSCLPQPPPPPPPPPPLLPARVAPSFHHARRLPPPALPVHSTLCHRGVLMADGRQRWRRIRGSLFASVR